MTSDGDAEPTFTIARTFAVPVDGLWAAWTTPGSLTQWIGPEGTTSTVQHFALTPGGLFHSRMDTPGGPMWSRFVYRVVDPPHRLVWAHAFADAEANVVRAPMSPTWPLELLTTVIFDAEDLQTRLTLTWEPLDATEPERQTFEAAMPGMEIGWSGSFDRLAAFLAQ